MSKKVLVAGGTGLVGRALISKLNDLGYSISVLSTRKNAVVKGADVFFWNPQEFEMDEQAIQGVDVVINLAGATVDHRWTADYKQAIFDSRTRTAETLYRALSKQDTPTVKTYISSSGVNYYPADDNREFTEDDENGTGFLAQVCHHWELGAQKMEQLGLRTVIFRTGMVLSRDGGALKKLEPLTKWMINAPVGSGKQWVSWIHISDLCDMLMHAIKNEQVAGIYNAVAPNPVTNTELTKAMAKALNRKVLLPNVPSVLVKALFGQMGSVVLEGQKCSAKKIEQTGFGFEFLRLDDALADLY